MRSSRKSAAVTLVLMLVMVLVPAQAALAVHDAGIFELDGNALEEGAVAGDDWSSLFPTDSSPNEVAKVFIADGTDDTGDQSYFTLGSSKDVRDVSEWRYVVDASPSAPDKNEITNAFAAAYVNGGGALNLYFGLDRFSNAGNANVGFWFFQNPVSLNPDGTFSGTHAVNDIFVVAEFTKGGKVDTIQVYRWTGSTPALQLLFTGADCASAASGDFACGRVNSEPQPAPWPYVPKGNLGDPGTFPAGTFFEAGVNLSALLPGADICFLSFMGETRSSQEPEAQLKDLALGRFDLCPSKSGTKFEDLNANGARDAGEPGLAGWEIHLFDATGAVHEHATTDASGNYLFSGLKPGSYTVCETQQAGWSQSFPTSGADCSGHGGGTGFAITLGLGEHDRGNDFGNYRQATKSGAKFHDLNANGVRDPGEPGLQGWSIHLAGTSAAVAGVHRHATTDPSGNYSFTSVPPGSYLVCEAIQPGWTQSFPGTGADCTGHGGGLGYAITLTSGQIDSGNDFGNYRRAAKTGVKFEDANGNAVRDAGDTLLEGWQIHLFGTAGSGAQIHEHAMTDADGSYSFDVPPGSYTVCETQQAGWVQSFPASGADCSGHGGGTGYTINLVSGDIDSGNDFGNLRLATKTGMKFEDLDADGVREAGEPGLEGWEIHLFGKAGDGSSIHLHTSTSAAGTYTFQAPPGTYTVCETVQPGWAQSFPASGPDCSAHGGGRGYSVVFSSGTVDAGNDFGNYRQATKTGTKFHDLNANGVRDPGEPGLQGWSIHLAGTSGAGADVHQHATTDSEGSYSFSIPPGTYLVCEGFQAGWTQSFPTSGASCSGHGSGAGGLGYAIALTSGQLDSGNDFGNYRKATKTGSKFEYRDADGTRDPGEPGLEGWQIHLFGTDGAGAQVHEHATTDASGGYSFSVPPGTYTVCETIQAGWTQSLPGTGADCTGHGGGLGYEIALASGQVDSGNDFGNYRRATKTGVKFEDSNGNGLRDAGEPGLPGWQIHLFGTTGTGAAIHEHAVTGAGGSYSFDVPPGMYTVCETQQPGWNQSFPASGADCSGHGGGIGYAIVLASGDIDSGNDFGNFRNATKTGAKFEDLDADGTRDGGEPGLGGWQIHLFGTAGTGAAIHEHATTDASGTYSFSVPPGSYTVCETQQAGWNQSFPASGADCSAHGGGRGYAIVLASGDIDSGNDFGNFRTATKTGVKFEDLNGNGRRDDGEPGLSGWQIHLFGTAGTGAAVHEHATTDGSGTYSFTVPPGVYTVCETVQAGWVQSFPAAGADCSAHGGGRGYAINLGSGQVDGGNDFGNLRLSLKSGVKFEDIDADGNRDDGEPVLGGWQIHLFGTAGDGTQIHAHTTTSPGSGAYVFSVPPGSYTVCETIQPGWTQSFPGSGADCTAHGGGRGYQITLVSGQVDAGNDFGNFRASTKTGVKFEDVDGDGVKDAGEPGLQGWEIHLFGTDGAGNAVHQHATTGAGGAYSFNVPPGVYTVCEAQQAGWSQSFPATGADCSAHGGGVGYSINLTSGSLDSDNDFGNFRASTKSGSKFEDLDADGASREAGEPGLGGWEIHLFGTDGRGNPVHLHATTGADGSYSIAAPPGTYTVCEAQQAGWTQSLPGASGADCSAHGGGRGYAITLTSGQTDSGNDFGNFRSATKSGAKFEDLDADGARDAGEPGLAGWEIHLFGTSGAGAAVHQHAATGADGSYSFNVPPGTYTVCETIQAGWTQSFPSAGASCSEHGGGLGYAITLVSGQTDSGNDFGNFRAATKTGVKFNDLDEDSVRDAGEPLLSGWEIHLFGTSTTGVAVHQHATTGADGSYSFSVPPGTYTVCETQQAGWAQTFPTAGADCTGHTHGGTITPAPFGYTITVGSGALDSGNDFGNFFVPVVLPLQIEREEVLPAQVLPVTGLDSGRLAIVGLTLLGLGMLMVVFGRRDRPQPVAAGVGRTILPERSNRRRGPPPKRGPPGRRRRREPG